MELTQDLAAIQSILTNADRTVGPLKKFLHIGGNESKLTQVCDELKGYLNCKNYILQENRINDLYSNEIKNIIIFLILNTDFKNAESLKIKEYVHLMNIVPALSKCVLFYVVMELGLLEIYGKIIQELPIELTEELIAESAPAIKLVSPQKVIYIAYTLSTAIITKESAPELQSEEPAMSAVVEKVNDVIRELLSEAARINPDKIQEWTKFQVYEHMGIVFNKYLDLLQQCDTQSTAQADIIHTLIRRTCNLIEAITLNVFCAWAEIQYDEDRPLQLVISESCYFVMEKYVKYRHTRALMNMLSTMARRPKTVQEQIGIASVATMIKFINKADANQQLWFTAFLHTDVFHDETTMDCLYKWRHLCTFEDLWMVFRYTVNHSSIEVKKLALNCADFLTVDELSIFLAKYFNNYGLNNNLQYVEIESELITKLNKINLAKEMQLSLDELDNSVIKEFQLFFLQNPETVLVTLFNECVKNMVYTFWLRHVFKSICNVVTIDSIALNTLRNTFRMKKINEGNNYNGYMNLIIMLNETKCCNVNEMVEIVLMPVLKEVLNEDEIISIKHILNIIRQLPIKELEITIKSNLALVSVEILEKFRCDITEFSLSKIEIVIASIEVLEAIHNFNMPIQFDEKRYYYPLNKYYVTTDRPEFLLYIYPNLETQRFTEIIIKLLQLLPKCTPSEWIKITNELDMKYPTQKSIELLTDTLILICDAVKLKQFADNEVALNALKYYLQTYGITIKFIKNKHKVSKVLEVDVIKNICRLIKAIPSVLHSTESINLISLFSEEALKVLVNDKHFVLQLASIEDKQIKQVISQKMLATL